MQAAVTMRDIALRAGVGQSTVSLALRDDPRLLLATRRRIQAIAKELGYRTNPLIATLMAQLKARKTKPGSTTIGIVNLGRRNWLRGDWRFSRLCDSAEQRAIQLGFNLDELWFGQPGMDTARLNQILRTRKIEGLIFPPGPWHAKVDINWSQIAAAAVGYSLEMPAVYRVNPHYQQAIMLAIRTVAKYGYKRPGLCISRSMHERTAGTVVGGFCACQQDMPDKQRLPVWIGRQKSLLVNWIKKNNPDIILWPGLLPVLEAVGELGLRVPVDIGLMHLDWRPELGNVAGIIQPWDLVGSGCVDLVVAQLHRNERGIPAVANTLSIDNPRWQGGESIEQKARGQSR